MSPNFMKLEAKNILKNGICLIEWGERIIEALPKDYLHLTFSKKDTDENIRILNITTNSKRWEDYFENIKY